MKETFTSFINSPKALPKSIEVSQNPVQLSVERFGVQTPESYLYTSRSKCYSADGIDDHADFAATLQAMATVGLAQHEVDDIFKVLSAILWLGNTTFVENNEGNADIADESVPNYVAYLMDVEGAAVARVRF